MATQAYDVINRINKQEKYSVFIADDELTKQLCYKLRYDVFASELGAELKNIETGIDKDRFDDHCQHVVVYDNNTSELVATTRLLDNAGREKIGMFYSETEFNLDNILNSDAKFMEVGRTCIHPAYRRGAVLALLWHGIAGEIISKNIDYLIGCASIPVSNGDKYITSVMKHIYKYYYAPRSLRVEPLVPLRLCLDEPQPDNVILPTLLKGYLRQGALICGNPYWDAAFGVADVFVLLESSQISNRYTKHFINNKV